MALTTIAERLDLMHRAVADPDIAEMAVRLMRVLMNPTGTPVSEEGFYHIARDITRRRDPQAALDLVLRCYDALVDAAAAHTARTR